MFSKYCQQIVCIIIFSFVFSTNVLPYKTRNYLEAEKAANQNTNTNVSVENGLTKINFNLKEGNINMYLPDDMFYGDTISGTIFIAPKGKNEKEKRKNLSKINDFKLQTPKDLINLKFAIPDEDDSVSIKLLPNVTNQARVKYITFSISKLQTDEKTGSTSVTFNLNSKKGKQISKFEIPIENKTYKNAGFNIPDLGQVGRPINIKGEFDGDLTNTDFQIENQNPTPFAESPRKSVFQSPPEVVGLRQARFKEGNTEILQEFRNLSVNLSATKLNLMRGESTNLTIKVGGLEGIEDAVPLNLNCTGSANMSGGNVQNLQISPNDVQADGSFVQERNLIGFRTGNFNVKANVLVNAKPKSLKDQIVHVESQEPKDFTGEGENEKVWYVKVKTLDGKFVDVYFKGNKPNLKFCDWIQITQIENDDIDRNVVKTFQPVDDPKKPCTLTNQEVRIDGNPLKMPDGTWRVKVKTRDGKTIYIRVNAPNKPDLKSGNWIKLKKCKKISGREFVVDGYDKTDDPNTRKPPAPVNPPPTPTPTSTPKPPPVVKIKPCIDGQTRRKRDVTKEFDILTKESTISMELITDKGTNDAKGFAKWLRGVSTLGGYVNVPEGARGGAAVATAALKYLEVGADILSALGESGLANKKVFEVKVKIFITTKKVRATCTSLEVCVSPAWVKKKTYSETSKESNVRREIRIDETLGNDWGKIVDPRTRTFDPERFETFAKELLKKELDKLKKNGEELDAFKKNCK